jgi:hypothetical protein
MKPTHHEIRICIEAGKRDIGQAQETIIRVLFQRYFAKDAYRAAIIMAFLQMVCVLALLYAGVPATGILLGLLGLGLLRALVKGLGLWASSPPPEPPHVEGRLPGPTQ